MSKNGEHFGLKVSGDSMIEAGILDGDTVIIRKQDLADTGDIVVARRRRCVCWCHRSNVPAGSAGDVISADCAGSERVASGGTPSGCQPSRGAWLSSPCCRRILTLLFAAGWSSPVARRAHNPKVVGSNPTPATKYFLFV